MKWIRKNNIEMVKSIHECEASAYCVRITELRLDNCVITVRYLGQTVYTASEIYDNLEKAMDEAINVLVSFFNVISYSFNSIANDIDPYKPIPLEEYTKFFISLGYKPTDETCKDNYFFEKGTNLLWVYDQWKRNDINDFPHGLVCMCPKRVFDRQSNSRHVKIRVYQDGREEFSGVQLALDIERGEWLCKHVKNDLFNNFLEIDI